jgi:SAM-dependent methyltransferase
MTSRVFAAIASTIDLSEYLAASGDLPHMPLKSILRFSGAYTLFQQAVGSDSCHEVFARDYLRPGGGDRVLDIGCGSADILEFLPEVDHLGVDVSPEYIESARIRFGGRGRFICKPVEGFSVEEPASFDIVMAHGVIHHLDDAAALGVARAALKPTGRFVSLDGAFVEGQSRLARIPLRNDRGKFVRSPEAYAALASRVFPEVKVNVRRDLLRIPYTHAILECSGASAPRPRDEPADRGDPRSRGGQGGGSASIGP